MRKKRAGVFFLIGAVLSFARTATVIFNMEKNSYDANTYYLLNNGHTKAFTVFMILCLAFAVFMGAFAGKGRIFIPDPKSDIASAASCMLAFILLGTVLIHFISSGDEAPPPLETAIVLLSAVSAAAFLIAGLRPCGSKANAVIMLAPLSLTAVRVIYSFIRVNSAPFASSGAYHITGLAVLLLYFLCEGKAYVSFGSAAFCCCYGYAAMLLLLVYAVPNLVLHCFGVLNFDYSASLSAVDIATAIYICARMSTGSVSAKADISAE